MKVLPSAAQPSTNISRLTGSGNMRPPGVLAPHKRLMNSPISRIVSAESVGIDSLYEMG